MVAVLELKNHCRNDPRERIKGAGAQSRSSHSTAGNLAAKLPNMKSFVAVVEKDSDTGLLVGYVPGWPGAHSQGDTLEELRANLREVIEMLLEDGEPDLEAEFVGTETVEVA